MIPKIIHFIYGLKDDFGGKPFSLVHYLAIKSAHEVNKPHKIYFYYKYLPSGQWWDRSTPYITLIKVSPPRFIFLNRLRHFAHKADVLRLKILKKHGGIYLDMDTICVRPLESLLSNEFVIGKQGGTTKGLCNAVMLSAPSSRFIKKWLHSYISFRSKGYDHFWDEHSVRKPLELSSKYPEILHVANERAFHYPSWEFPDQTKLLFEECHEFNEAYVHHLWESTTWDPYLSKLTPEYIFNVDTSYNLLARKFL